MGSKKASPVKEVTTKNEAKFALPTMEVEGQPADDASTTSAATINTNTVLITCKHLPAMAEFLKMYHSVCRALRWSKELSGVCAVCSGCDAPMLICLQCPYFGCWREESHWQTHNGETGHALAVERVSGVVYCAVCKCWVWTDCMSRAWQAANSSPADSCLAIRAIELYTGEYADLPKVCPSVRGLYNLGNTCFMNSVLQMMLHTVPLKHYFLASVRPHACKKESCIACELDGLFCRVNDGKTTPLAPHQLLLALWKSSRDMAGYDQQDAHELFVTLRNALHHDLNGASFNCACIVHKLFAGVLQSDITCGACGHVAETLDPFLDISLDLPVSGGSTPVQLDACLQRFTRTEKLPAGSFVCARCHQSGAEIEKRLTIRSHPKVLAIHLKRFDGASKIDIPIQFPPTLSLDAYLATASESSNYYLYAVISHVGSLDSGHYTSYVRCRDEWFWADDACVSACSEEDVYNSNAYMIFYIEK